MTDPTHRKPQNKVTVSNISQILGLSKGTVSKALNNYTDVSRSTRELVLRTARQLGYVNAFEDIANSKGRTNSFGLVVEAMDYELPNPYLPEFIAGICKAATDEGWALTMVTSDNTEDTLKKIELLVKEKKADGFIIPQTRTKDCRIEFLRNAKIPFVLFGRVDDCEGCSWFDIRSEVAMEQAVRYLADLGHSRIAFVNGATKLSYSVYRKKGFIDGMASCQLRVDPSLVIEDVIDPVGGYLAARSLLAKDRPPTAIMYALDAAAMGLYRAAEEIGLQVGTDLSVVSYDGLSHGQLLSPPLSTFSARYREAGEMIAHLLIQQLAGNAPQHLRETTLPVFVENGSAGKPRLASEAIAKVAARSALLAR